MNSKHIFTIVAVMFLGGNPVAFAGNGPGGSGGTTTPATGFDTSYAVEASYSCLSGGCHETNIQLLDGYKASYMTHAMVKCNTCHGTHTAAELGLPKPNLTGYVPGKGATGYVMGKDRCLACHSSALSQSGHPKNPTECISCHTPHTFAR